MKKGKVIFILPILTLILSTGLALNAEKLTEEQMTAYRTRPAVVMIYSGMSVTANIGGQQMQLPNYGSGSGFFINPEGYLVTNGHVVDIFVKYSNDKDGFAQQTLNKMIIEQIVANFKQANGREPNQQELQEQYAEFVKKSQPRVVDHESINYVLLSNSETFRFEVKKFSPSIPEGGKDIAILKIERENCPVIFLGDSSKLSLQQMVFTIGFPGAVDPGRFPLLGRENTLKSSITRGSISALKTDYKGMSVIQHDAATSPGNSGGPTVSADGLVIGVHSYAATMADGFKFCVPINSAKEFIQDAGVNYNKSSEFTVVYNKLLKSVWEENWFDAQTEVSTALAYMKNEPDLEQLQRSILLHISEMGFLEKMWRQNKIVIIIAVILMLAILAVLYFSFRPSQSSPASVEPAKVPETQALEEAVPEDKTTFEGHDGTVFEGDLCGSLTVIVRGEEQGTYPITSTAMIIGRDPTSTDVTIKSDLASKNHLKIIPKGEQFYIIDLGSTNGTYVNGEKISESLINPDDQVQLGKRGEIKLIFKK